MRKKTEELKELEEQLLMLERQKINLIQKSRNQNQINKRRKRAHRLIQTGALAEKYFEMAHLSISEKEELFKMFSGFINSNKPKEFKKQPPE